MTSHKPQQSPICPDVALKSVPFYQVLCELIKPTKLVAQEEGVGQVTKILFSLSSQELSKIQLSKETPENPVEVQLRFFTLDTFPNPREDAFPPSLSVRVNGKTVSIGKDGKRTPRPLNITQLLKLDSKTENSIAVKWTELNLFLPGHACSLFLVKKLSCTDLVKALQAKGARPAANTRDRIRNELLVQNDGDKSCDSVESLSKLTVTLACPLGKGRMTSPCRATTCEHFQCFDANLFLQMNERTPKWMCPVCIKPCLFEHLFIDGYFEEILSEMPEGDCTDVELVSDGSWKKVLTPSAEDSSTFSSRDEVVPENKTIDLEDEEESEEGGACTSNAAHNTDAPIEVIDLVDSDNEDYSGPITRTRGHFSFWALH